MDAGKTNIIYKLLYIIIVPAVKQMLQISQNNHKKRRQLQKSVIKTTIINYQIDVLIVVYI